MNMSHTTNAAAIPELNALLEFVTRRLALCPDEAAQSQPDFERALREHTLAFERAVHALDFARMDVDAPGLVVEDVRYRRRGRSTGHYTTLAGPISVERTTYRERGGHGGKSIAALDLRLGLLANHWTPVAAQVATTFVASAPTVEAQALLRAAGTMTPSSSHLDRITKHAGGLWESKRVELEEAVRNAERLDLPSPEKVATIAMSLDGVMVPMKDAPRTPGLGKADQGPKGHKEASSGTVTLYDRDGERLHTVRFARMPESKKKALHRQLVAELEPFVEYYPHAKVVAVCDGAKENWRIVAEIAEELGIEIVQRLDFYHAVGHLREGLKAAGLDMQGIAEWCSRMKHEHDIGDLIAEELSILFACKGKQLIDQNCGFFVNNAERIDYAHALAANEPIGSGVQEAACKTLVTQRMKRSGMSWREPGGQAVLTFRSLAQSNRLQRAWDALGPTLHTAFSIDHDTSRKRPMRSAA